MDFDVLVMLLVAGLRWLIAIIQPAITPICFVTAWALCLLCIWNVWSAFRHGFAQAKTMHKIPCASCQFFSGDYHLKCPVQPQDALTEKAINCADYVVRMEPIIPHRLLHD